jgi:hypothetical protein
MYPIEQEKFSFMNPHTFLLRSKSSGRLHKKNYNLTNHFAVMHFVSTVCFFCFRKNVLIFFLLNALSTIFYNVYFSFSMEHIFNYHAFRHFVCNVFIKLLNKNNGLLKCFYKIKKLRKTGVQKLIHWNPYLHVFVFAILKKSYHY